MFKCFLRIIFFFLLSFMFIEISAFSDGNQDPVGSNPKMWREDNLGTQITYKNLRSASFGNSASGKHLLSTPLFAHEGVVAIVDVESGEILKIQKLEDAKGIHANTFSRDGKLYLGGYMCGRLYCYDPSKDLLEDLGKPFGEATVLYEAVEDKNGKIYGGTYPKGKVYQFDPEKKQFKSLGSMVDGEDYVRSIAYDPDTNHVFAGIGSHAALIRLNPITGEKKDILPPEYKQAQFVDALDIVGGKMIARINPGGITLVFDLKTQKVDTVLSQFGSQEISPKSPLENAFYYSAGKSLMKYDIDKKTSTDLKMDLKGEALSFSYGKDKDGAPVMFIISSSFRLYTYNLKENTITYKYISFPPQPVPLHNLFKGPDGKIYCSGFIVRRAAIFDPQTGESKEYSGTGQSEGITSIGRYIYFGVYPHARIYIYDTIKEWDQNKGNPKQIFTLDNEKQDRPFGMLGVEKENKLFIGTIPTYGQLGGALSIYDLQTKNIETHRNIIPNQSIVSLCYRNGMIIGGSSIFGGLGIRPTEKEAKLFIWDIQKGEKIYETAPVPGKLAITCLKASPDGMIWGWAEGNLFIFDPDSRKVIFTEKKFPIEYSPEKHVWRDAFMEYGNDGYFYGIFDKFMKPYRMNAKTREIEFLSGKDDLHLLARDDEGYIYCSRGKDLIRLSPPE